MNDARVRRVTHLLGQVLLSVAALVGVLCLLVVLSGVLFGVKPLIFRSGSMEPAIPTGSLALARTTDAADLQQDDVISVKRSGTWVTHRIVEIEPGGERSGKPVYVVRLQGDGNQTPDPVTDSITSAPRVFAHVGHLGGMLSWLGRPPGIYVLALYLALCVGVMVRGNDEEEPEQSERLGEPGETPEEPPVGDPESDVDAAQR